ncbi:predicted protein [Coccidioides posadasii str. Silveira]|uniref:Predicted protein n=1 Tax=Coccidioides posadasii (strain RMSCC 757 / Silveira) TaxID=443226 RepID=E9D8Y6_COCPS|nr:predicted protein [Coccidioides posadasii str. Silveira]
MDFLGRAGQSGKPHKAAKHKKRGCIRAAARGECMGIHSLPRRCHISRDLAYPSRNWTRSACKGKSLRNRFLQRNISMLMGGNLRKSILHVNGNVCWMGLWTRFVSHQPGMKQQQGGRGKMMFNKISQDTAQIGS